MKSSLIFFFIFLLIGCTRIENPNEIIKHVIYKDVTVIDGLGNQPYLASIFVKDSIIEKIVPGKLTSWANRDSIVVCHGKYVIPGLIDTHVHATVLNFDGKHKSTVDFEASLHSLRRMSEFGVFYVRSVAGPLEEGIRLKQIADSAKFVYPTIFTTGPALNKSNYPPYVKVSTADEVTQEVKRQNLLGVDAIKVYASLEPELVKVAIDEVQKRNLKIIGHLQRTSWTDAANMGIDFITHAAPWSPLYLSEKHRLNYVPTMKGRLDWIDYVDYESDIIREMIGAMKLNEVSFDPTLIAFHTKFWAKDSSHVFHNERSDLAPSILNMWNSVSYVDDWTDSDFKRAKSLWPKLAELTHHIYKAGIPITVGTDFPNPWVYPGLSVHKEMQLLNEAGIPALEVIKMATYNGAVALGIEEKIGSIEEGKSADLISLNADPTKEIRNTLMIDFILKSGRCFFKATK